MIEEILKNSKDSNTASDALRKFLSNHTKSLEAAMNAASSKGPTVLYMAPNDKIARELYELFRKYNSRSLHWLCINYYHAPPQA